MGLAEGELSCRNFQKLFSDGGLSAFAVFQGKILNDVFCVVGGAFHRNHARTVLGSTSRQQHLVKFEMHVIGHDFGEDLLWTCSKMISPAGSGIGASEAPVNPASSRLGGEAESWRSAFCVNVLTKRGRAR